MRAEMFAVGRSGNEILAELSRLDARQPQPPAAEDLIEPLQQMPQAKRWSSRSAASCIDAVMADVNSGQHDFFVAEVDQPADLGFDVVGRAAFESRPDLRNDNDAVRTAQQAAVLHFHERSLVSVEAADPGRKFSDTQSQQHIGQFPFVGDDFDHIRQPRDGIRIVSRVAAGDNRLAIRVLASQLPYDLPPARISVLSHRASVDDAEVGRL